MTALVVSGTDTDIGKTVFAAALVGALDGYYWKPVQAGLDANTDTDEVRRLSGLPADRVLPEVYRLRTPASPHLAAERDGIEIDVERLVQLPPFPGCQILVIEGAGGLLVPMTRRDLQIDLFGRWRAPVVLIAATKLGTINHTLLSVEALRSRGIPIVGVAFSGDANADSERAICDLGGVRRLGRLPKVDPLDAAALRHAFAANFRIEDFLTPVST